MNNRDRKVAQISKAATAVMKITVCSQKVHIQIMMNVRNFRLNIVLNNLIIMKGRQLRASKIKFLEIWMKPSVNHLLTQPYNQLFNKPILLIPFRNWLDKNLLICLMGFRTQYL